MPILNTLKSRANNAKQTLILFAQKYFQSIPNNKIKLFAIGGLGRGHIFKHSDFDILILTDTVKTIEKYKNNIENFIQHCWDHKLNISHSVRSINDGCLEEDLKHDPVFYTSLLEAEQLYPLPKNKLSQNNKKLNNPFLSQKIIQIYSLKQFYHHKLIERKKRILKNQHNLEPSIKNHPGALRDIHLIYWLCLRFLKNSHLKNNHLKNNHLKNLNKISDAIKILISNNILTHTEIIFLKRAYIQLSKLREFIHNRHTASFESFLFEDQIEYTKSQLNILNPNKSDIEKSMKLFYTTTQTVQAICETVLTRIEELTTQDDSSPIQLNTIFQIKTNRVDLKPNINLTVDTVLEGLILFCDYQSKNKTTLSGLTAQCYRSMEKACQKAPFHLIQTPSIQKKFLKLFTQSIGITRALNYLIHFGFMDKYFPESIHTRHQMQFDLFHVHTVDIHTLEVIKQLRKLVLGELTQDLSLIHPTELAQSLLAQSPKSFSRLYFAVYFHDMGKGTGEDHSTWGARHIQYFSKTHGFSKEDTDLMTWLVQNHLLFSDTAQKKDISDPLIIQQFLDQIPSQEYLDYLYLLTISDIRGTQLKLWNHWRATLIQQLYQYAHQALDNKLNKLNKLKNNIFNTISNQLNRKTQKLFKQFWPSLSKAYLQRFTQENIIQHIDLLYSAYENKTIQIHCAPATKDTPSTITLATPRYAHLFSKVTQLISNLNLEILEARIYTLPKPYLALASFSIVNSDYKSLSNLSLIKDLTTRLNLLFSEKNNLNYQNHQNHSYPNKSKRLIETFKNISIPVQIEIYSHETHPTTCFKLNIKTINRPGLLADIGAVIKHFDMSVLYAKIMTIGEQVEDSFTLAFNTPTDIHTFLNTAQKIRFQAALVANVS